MLIFSNFKMFFQYFLKIIIKYIIQKNTNINRQEKEVPIKIKTLIYSKQKHYYKFSKSLTRP